MKIPRYLTSAVERTLAMGKMAFVGGPRQVGKTTLALSLLGSEASEAHPAYFNWDDSRSAARLRRLELPPGEALLVLDEVHKYARWRNLLKGIHDTEKAFRRIVVTGSARLDFYRKGGDSLANRYRHFRLHPLSLRELETTPSASALETLLRFGGFPEPFLRQDETEHRLWQRDRLARVVREDLRDLERSPACGHRTRAWWSKPVNRTAPPSSCHAVGSSVPTGPAARFAKPWVCISRAARTPRPRSSPPRSFRSSNTSRDCRT